MAPKSLLAKGILAAGICLSCVDTGLAQFHSHGSNIFDRALNLFDPFGQQVTTHLDQYHYLVPPTHHHHGTYYTYENQHYYTPPAPRSVAGQRVVRRPVVVDFNAFKHQDELAERLEKLTNQLCLDLHYNYRHNRGFQETYTESYQLLQLAKYLHDSEHRGDKNAIRKSARSLDNLFHHVQDDVKNWSRVEHRYVGEVGTLAKMEEIEALIHHLMYDVGVKPDHDHDEVAPPPEDEVAPPPASLLR
jgi:hypothetical protein